MKISADQFTVEPLTEQAQRAVRAILGDAHAPAIFILGAMRRSGTVYAGELVHLHPHVTAYPNQLWEVPFLRAVGSLLEHQEDFFKAYEPNRSRIGTNDLAGVYAASLLAYLQSFVREGARVLIKDSSLGYLPYLPVLFPSEFALLLLRDGRDTVHSTLKSWPGMFTFSEVCEQWNDNVRLALEFHKVYRNDPRYWLVHYEDVLDDPHAFAAKLCRRFGLEPARYPFDRIDGIEVRGSSTLADAGAVHWNPIARPPGFRPTHHWRSWSRHQREQFARLAGDTLREAGYCADMEWVSEDPEAGDPLLDNNVQRP